MKRKGFTLVELLIVIVVIGILSAMMMMSSTEAVSSAKASNIVSNLRNLKTAALAMYADNMDYFTATKVSDIATAVKSGAYKNKMWDYLNGGSNIPDKANYKLAVAASGESADGVWWVICKITGTKAEQDAIKRKLAGRAKSLGLKGINVTNENTFDTGNIGNADATKDFDTTHGAVMLRVR